DLLRHLADSLESASVLVSHDLGVVAGTCDRGAVLYAGRVVETGPTDVVFGVPTHPYTAGLLRSVPRIDQAIARLPFIPGQPPAPGESFAGCGFAPRCPGADQLCFTEVPRLVDRGDGRSSACHHPEAAKTAFPTSITTVDIASAPVTHHTAEVARGEQLVELTGGRRHYRARRSDPPVRAVDGVDLEIRRGEFLGLVGESGCGKSTLGRILAGLDDLDDGNLSFDGRSVAKLRSSARREFRRRAQLIFQDPRSSLDRRMSIGDQLAEGLRNAGVPRESRAARVAELLELVGLPGGCATRLPGEFSGGQAQRVAIARSLSVDPDLLIADEAVSSLDVSIKGQVVNLLRDLQRELGLSVLFISHDLGVVRQVADRVAVMYLGRFVEVAETNQLFTAPQHPYTQALLSAIPLPDPTIERKRQRILLTGDVPSPAAPPPGCRFHTRCQVGPCSKPERTRCVDEVPELRAVAGAQVACHFAEEEGTVRP
ncbi:MAG TPA: dipeptide ABC transporter ATP-binding protein, partial [Nocardioides sp.]